MTIELRTGLNRPARREDYCTKTTAAKAGGECPLWHKFLDEITNRDPDLQAYLQRMAGYCLTGITDRTRAVFPLWNRRQRQGRLHQHAHRDLG